MNKFLSMLSKEPKKVTYGKQEVLKALEMGAIEVLLLSEEIPDEEIEELEEKSHGVGTEIKVISSDTNEGKQLTGIGNMAAILRYSI